MDHNKKTENDSFTNKKKKVEELGTALAQIKARVKANRSCARKDDNNTKTVHREILSERSEKYIQVLELDKAKAQKLERDRPKIKEAIENLMIDRENQKLVEKRIEESRAKQSAPLPEIPAEIQKRISDLEITIHHLKESLSEKERVLESKTESWKLLSDQLEQRNIEVLDRYDVMAKEIEEVKNNYAEQEKILRSELEKYKQRVEQSDSLLISQENSNQENKELKLELENLKSVHSECESKYSNEHRLCLKLQAKIRSYRNEINSNKEISKEVERLKNEIASLEEEKESSSKNLARANEMESALKQLEIDLNEARIQCQTVNQEYADLCSKLEDKESIIQNLKESLEKMEQSKISSEFKAAELEEKLESEDRAENNKMLKEIENLKRHVKQQDDSLGQLKVVIEQKEDEIRALKDNGADYSFTYDTQDLKELLDEWKEKYSRIQENVRKVEEDKETLEDKVRNLQSELNTVSSKYQHVDRDLNEKEKLLQEYVKKNQELVKTLEETNEKLSELQSKSKSDGKTDDQTHKLKKLAANLKIKVKLCKELEDKVNQLSQNLEQCQLEKTDLENIVSQYKIKLEKVSLDSDVVDSLKNLLSEKEVIIEKLKKEQDTRTADIQRVRTQSQCEIDVKETEIKHLKEENLMLESKLNENLIEIHCVDEDKKSVMNQEQSRDSVESLNLHIQHLNYELEGKVKIIDELGSTIADLTHQIQNNNICNEFEQQKLLIEQLKEEVERLNGWKQSTESDLLEKNELIDKIKHLESELNNCHSVISQKEDIITHFEKEINSLKHDLILNESQMNKIQDLYVEEYNKKDTLLTNIETELNLSKNEILILTDQLGEVSKNYENCMEKIKEKDDYIDKLEKDLEDMRTRFEKLQTSIDQRQKSMEAKSQEIGDKLKEAANISCNFEQYRNETQLKLHKFEEIEKQLHFKINELTQDIEILKASNEELMKLNENLDVSKREAEKKKTLLESELDDIKAAYNTTLDQIETLNEELKQVMSQIEFRDLELVRIGEERNALVSKLTELEQKCGELTCQLERYQCMSETLKNELDIKIKELDIATHNLQNQMISNQQGDNDLSREVEELKKEYEQRLKQLQIEKEDLINVLKDSVAQQVDSVVKDAQNSVMEATRDIQMKQDKKQIVKEEEIKLFTWGANTENSPGETGIEISAQDEFHDDGWGWNPSDAKLEEEYQNSESKTKQMENEIEQLKTQNATLQDEVKSVKVKCSKLLAKVKELKVLSEKEKTKTGFDDLNFALQEEMRSQVDEMEKKNKELLNEINSMKIEKDRLLKRVETLTSANNQLIEMKERQDVELQVWQRNCTELKNQLQTFDWNETQMKSPVETKPIPSDDRTESKLEQKLTFLETENEELLQMICSLKDEKQAQNQLSIELDNIKEENKRLKEKLSTYKETEDLLEHQYQEVNNQNNTIKKLTEENHELEKQVNKLKEEYEEIMSKYNGTNSDEQIQHELEMKNNQILTLTKQIDSLQQNVDNLTGQNKLDRDERVTSLSEQINTLQQNLSQISIQNELYCNNINDKDNEISNLKERLSQLDMAVQQVQDMQNEQMQLSNEIERLQAVVQSLSQDNSNLLSSYDSKLSEIDLLKADMKILQNSKDVVTNELESVREEFSRFKSGNVQSNVSPVVDDRTEPPVFKMDLNYGNDFNTSTPIQTKRNEDDISIAQSPPVFRGFFSQENNSSIPSQFDVLQTCNTTDTQNFTDFTSQNIESTITSQNFTESTSQNVESNQIGSLRNTINRLEEENSQLNKKLEEIQAKSEALSLTISEKDDEMKLLHNQISQLNEQINLTSSNLVSEKSDLLIKNQELINEIKRSETNFQNQNNEVQKLHFELSELKKYYEDDIERIKIQEINKSETNERILNDVESLKQRYERQIIEKEQNYQNLLLNKDEENAHLVCEVSSKQNQLEKLIKEMDELKSTAESLKSELNISSSTISNLTQQIDKYKFDLDKLNVENNELKKNNENNTQLLNAQVDYLQQTIEEKQTNMNILQSNCEQLQIQVNILQQQLDAALERSSYLENCYSTLNATHSQQSSDVAALQDRLRVAESEIQRLTSYSNELNESKTRLEQEKLVHESDKTKEINQITVLTNEIELLQSALTEKDLEIERLSKLLTVLQEKLIKLEESKETDEVSRLRGKLDESLYTLHQTDVKCDELTVEIMQLLEERDSLQLRLSEAIREIESLKSVSNQLSIQSSGLQTNVLTQLASSQNLSNKIGELHSGYMKDPTVQMDRENRYSQQMHLYSSADSTLGVEEAKKLQQSQPSSDYGILNWFFSSSTAPQPSQEPGT